MLDLVLEEFMHEDIVMLARDVDVRLFRQPIGPLQHHANRRRHVRETGRDFARCGRRNRPSSRLVEHLIVSQAIDQRHDQAFGQLHHRLIVAIRLVQLHHGELGIVLLGDAFIAEDSPGLANSMPTRSRFRWLQAMRRNVFDVEGVVVRDERPGRRPARDGVQRRRLDFTVSSLIEIRTHPAGRS